MISEQYKFIYLHAPKTAGNSIQKALLPYSSDRLLTKTHQDGVERFSIEGDVTKHKHALLSDYAETLGPRLPEFRVALSVRHPFQRAVSYYLTPSRWMKQDEASGTWELRTPEWNLRAFARQVSQIAPMSAFLTVGEAVHTPDWLIRYENLATDFDAFARAAGLPMDRGCLGHLNQSASRSLFDVALRDDAARQLVAERFASDFQMFGYEP